MFPIGEVLREMRVEQGLSQEDVAKRGGIAHGTWNSWETGKHWPRKESYESIAKGLGCRIEVLGWRMTRAMQELYGEEGDEPAAHGSWQDVLAVLDEIDLERLSGPRRTYIRRTIESIRIYAGQTLSQANEVVELYRAELEANDDS